MHARSWFIAGVILALGAGSLQALPVEGGYAPQAYRESRPGYARLPTGAQAYYHGGYRYYRYGGAFYTPFMYRGRTVYVLVDQRGGQPAPPPPAASIDVDFQ